MSTTAFAGALIEALAVSNLKSVGEQAALLANLASANTIANNNLAAQNAVAHQQAMNQLGMAITGMTVRLLQTRGPLESKSVGELMNSAAVVQELIDLKAAVAGLVGRK